MRTVKNKDVEQLLFSAFADAAPDKADEIIQKASAKRAPGALMSIDQVNYRQKYIHYFTVAAAALVLIAGIILSIVISRNNEVVGTVTVEGVECYEIAINRACRPLSISGRDSAAKQSVHLIPKDYDTLSEAVDHVLDTMLDTGSLNDDCNTVLITVSLDDRSEEQLGIAIDAAKGSFDDAVFDGAILGTVASSDHEVLSISRHNTVSVGKAEMVWDILAVQDLASTSALCRLSINDLNLYSLYYQIPYESISVYGVSHGCITPDQAAELALRYLNEPSATAEAVLGCDETGLLYIVTVWDRGEATVCRLSATTGELIPEDIPAATESHTETVSPSAAPTSSATQPTDADKTEPSASNREEPDDSPQPTVAQQPTSAAKPTQVPTQKPTSAPKPTEVEPDIFTRSAYYRYTAGIYGSEILPSGARQISVRRVFNGYDTYYGADTFPYSAQGAQGGITALVFNTTQFRNLTGTDDSRFDDEYFKTHALYVNMNRDADYHWTKSIDSAYINGSVLYIEDAEPIGRYVGDQETKIHTVIYELNKDDLRSFTNMLEFE